MKLILAVSFLIAAFWGLFVILIVRVKQSPEAQVRRRVDSLIKNAEVQRAKLAKKKKEISTQKELKKDTLVGRSKFYAKYISPIFDMIDQKVQIFIPVQLKNLIEEKVFQAGKTGIWSLPRVISFCAISVIAGAGWGIAITTMVEFHFLQEAMIVLLGTILGAIFPITKLNKIIEARKKVIKRTLPEFLDLLCVSVQAGLSFDAAVSKITVRMSGPLIDEFKRFQNDVSLGMTRQYALNQMARRCNLEELYLFTSSVIQAEKLGTSMGRTLKIQADNMRERHRQYIKAEALKAPVKIIFPMVFFIFPSVFVVVLFPAFLSFVKNLGK